jgi:hypothetical protein
MKLFPKKNKSSGLRSVVAKNAEKVVFFLVVAGCVAMIIFTGGQKLTKPPTVVKDLADYVSKADTCTKDNSETAVSKYMNSRTWHDDNFAKTAKDSKKTLDVKLFEYVALWNEPIYPQLARRREPPLLPVEELRAVADRDGFTRGSAVTGQRFVAITGAIPQRQQSDEFKRVFLRAQMPDPLTDAPKYEGYEVKRLEVRNRWGREKIDWNKIEGATLIVSKDAQSKASAFGTPIAEPDPSYTNAAITFPLPARNFGVWGSEISHEKLSGVPFELVRQNPTLSKGKRVVWSGDPLTNYSCEDVTILMFSLSVVSTTEEEQKRFFAVKFPSSEVKKQFEGSTAKIKGIVEDAEVVIEGEKVRLKSASDRASLDSWPLVSYDAPPAPASGPGESPDSFAGEYSAPAGKPLDRPGAMGEDQNDYLLFRFLDFNVQSGKYYRYAVRLMLKNPNYKKSEHVLMSPDLAQSEFIYTEWKDLPDPVFVPEDGRVVPYTVVFKSPPKSASTTIVDPASTTVSLSVMLFDEKTGRKAMPQLSRADNTRVLSGGRGYVANGLTLFYLDNSGGDKSVSNIDSNTLIVDIHADRNERGPNNPGAVIVLTPNGNLDVRESFDGKREVRQFETGDVNAGGAPPAPKAKP